MDALSNVFSTGVGLLIAIAMWAILFVVIREALKRGSPFSGWTTPVLAVCVSLLCVIGMFRLFVGTRGSADSPETEDPFGFLLLPYALLGLAIFVVLILILLLKTLSSKPQQRHEEKGPSREEEERPEQPFNTLETSRRARDDLR